MPENDAESALRIGGWVPPYSAAQNTPRKPRNDSRRFADYAGAPATPAAIASRRPILVPVVVVVLGALTLALIGLGVRYAPVTPGPPLVAIPAFVASPPVSVRPPAPAASPTQPAGYPPSPVKGSETGGSSRPVKSSLTGARQAVPPSHSPAPPSHSPAPPSHSPAPTASRSPTPTPTASHAVSLRVGATVGLEPYGRSGYRVRHRNFLGRVDPVDEQSSALDRADSRFVVRPGFVADGCVALESVNYPGYFLRHFSFVIRLNKNDGSRTFAKDATFCPIAVRQGAALVLQSANYRSRYLSEQRGQLFLDEVAPDRATAFVVRPAR